MKNPFITVLTHILLLVDDFYLLMIYLESTMFFLPKNTKYHKSRFVFHGVKLFRLRDKKTRFCSFAMVEGLLKSGVKTIETKRSEHGCSVTLMSVA